MHNQKLWTRRNFLRFSGGAASVALLAACQPITRPSPATSIAANGIGMGMGEVRFAYVGTYNRTPSAGGSAQVEQIHPVGIAVFAVAPTTGAFTLIESVPSDNPSFLAIHPTQRYLYVCNEIADYEGKQAGSVEAYAIDETTGKLTLLNRQAVGSIPVHIAIDPSGSYLVVANYIGASYQVLLIKSDGSLEPVSDEVKQKGSGPHVRQEGPHPRCVIFDPGGRYVATADLGTDKTEIFKLDNAKLVKISEASVAPGSGPRHLAFHPTGKALYVSNELTGTITVFAYQAESGQLGNEIQTIPTLPATTLLPESSIFLSGKSNAEIMIHPSGKFLYGSNLAFEDHQVVNVIMVLSIDEKTGKLGPVINQKILHDEQLSKVSSG